jgi:hypothetical protein
VFSGEVMDGDSTSGNSKTGKFCADCEVSAVLLECVGIRLMEQSTEHDTVDCPLAEDVF